MHFLVTGGAGFIGSHLIEDLLAAEYKVTAIDDLSSGNLQNLPEHYNLTFIQKNILACQPQDFAEPIDGLVHLAAIPSVTASWLKPLQTHKNNLSTTLAAIELCQALKIPRLVFASSAAVYGDQTSIPIREDCQPNPISPYGLQKLTGEQYATMFAHKLGFSFVGLRLFNMFGPRQLFSSQYSGVISIFISAMKQNLPITIYGDGSQTRDFVFVKDVAAAFTKALIVDLPLGSSTICNIGTGKSTSILQLVQLLKDFFPHWNKKVSFTTARAGDVEHSQADMSKAALLLNFTPQWSVASGLEYLCKF